MWTSEQISYLAGFIDGEGTIYISTRKTKLGYISYYPRFQAVNTNKEVMEWILKTFGGLLYTKDRSSYNKKWRVQYEWYTTRALIDELLPLILPYLIVKRPQAELMLKFRATFKRRSIQKIPEDILNIREQCLHDMRVLNLRGVHTSSALLPVSVSS